MFATSSTSLLLSLLPKKLIQEIESENIAEKSMLAISTLVSNIVIGASKAWEKGEVKKLDPNPGDGGCQIRGYLLYLFYSDESLRKEVSKLRVRFEKTKEVINRRNVEVCNKKSKFVGKSSGLFFKEQFSDIELSKQIAFLFQCYLLAVTRTPYERLPNGIVLTKTDIALLAKLSGKISIVSNEERRKIVETAQSNISANSVELLREEAKKLTSFQAKEKEEVLYMLSPEMTRVYTTDLKYEPKTFGVLFYEYKTILFRLREDKGLLCFKSIVPKGEIYFWIFLQPKEPQKEFSVIPDDAYSQLSSQSPMVVFEGVVNAKYGKKDFCEKITEIGFTELILAAAAIEPPYERTSDLSYLKNEQAQLEITRYRELAEKIECQKDSSDPMLILDHVYFNVLAAEIGKKV